MRTSHILLVVPAFVIGCGYYSFSGSANPHIKTVAVPVFEDRTVEFGVKDQLTNAIIESFTRDNTLKIANRRDADSIVHGTLLKVEDRSSVYTAQENVQEIRVYVTVAIKYEDVKKRKTIWEEQLIQFGTYAPGGANTQDRQNAINEAIEKIATEVLNKSVSAW